jgi:hypothetical protein
MFLFKHICYQQKKEEEEEEEERKKKKKKRDNKTQIIFIFNCSNCLA